MEAIYFGNAHWSGCHDRTGPIPCKGPGGDRGNTGAGPTGPWVGADLESGMYYGGGEQTTVNNRSQPLTSPFVSLHLKGKSDGFALKGGDATKGSFVTMYDGPRPKPWTKGKHQGSYQPMYDAAMQRCSDAAATHAPMLLMLCCQAMSCHVCRHAIRTAVSCTVCPRCIGDAKQAARMTGRCDDGLR